MTQRSAFTKCLIAVAVIAVVSHVPAQSLGNKHVGPQQPDASVVGDIVIDWNREVRNVRLVPAPEWRQNPVGSLGPKRPISVLPGRGKRFFSDSADPRELALVSTKASSSGVLMNTYRPVGSLRT